MHPSQFMVSNKNLVPTSRIAIVKFIYIHWFILKSQFWWEGVRKAIQESQNAGRLTSFWLGKTFVQVKNNFVYKVLNVAVLWSSNKHHPIMGEALHSRFLPDLSTMTKFQFHLDCTLWSTKQSITKEIVILWWADTVNFTILPISSIQLAPQQALSSRHRHDHQSISISGKTTKI